MVLLFTEALFGGLILRATLLEVICSQFLVILIFFILKVEKQVAYTVWEVGDRVIFLALLLSGLYF